MSKKILIADDEEDVKVVVQLFLESKGYEIVTAFDGLDALDKTRQEKPDLILLDIMMPIMDGFEVCKKIKADPVTAEIPVVMLSASSHSESKARGLEAGAVEYIIKPFEPDQLEETLRRHLK
jgi:two-component system alkaline phosphatase synthesis response regulator PhoP